MVPEMISDAVVATVPTVVEAATKHLRPVVQVELKRPDGAVHKVKGLSHSVLPKLLRVLATGKHVFLPGPAGTGKSHMARQAAQALGKPFYAVSVGPTMLESKLLGYMDAKGEFISTVFYEWTKKGGVFLLDEVDNGNPSVLNVMNAALANKFVGFPNGEMVELHQDCICLAAGNTFGTGPDRAYVGRQALDAAFLNRFVFLEVPIDEALEEQLCLATGLDAYRVGLSLSLVRRLRRKIAELKLPIVMGPRNAEAFCALLAAGFVDHEATDMALRKGLSDADWRKISSEY
jgi:cobaltochelatase CobS